jgi:hypothetical protein
MRAGMRGSDAMTPTTPNVFKEDVEAFCAYCVSLRSLFCHFLILFEEGADLRRDLLKIVAPTFFGDLNLILREHLILQICKITDPEQSQGNKNLTVKFLINNSDFSAAPLQLDKLKQLSDSMHAFREKIVPARNKFIGHLDRHSVHDGKALGAADKKEWNQFWLDLQDFVHILDKRYINPNSHFYLNDVAMLSDADTLIRALKQSTYFNELIKDQTIGRKCGDVAFGSKYFNA